MFALAAVVVATLCGSSGCFGTTMLPFQGSADLIWSLRYPHAMSAFVVGALLALAGAPAKRRLILTGVMIASGFGALITLMLSLACDNALRGSPLHELVRSHANLPDENQDFDPRHTV